jgi:triosephosphate isomerase
MHPSRKPLIAGNWKMNLGGLAGLELAMRVKALAPQVPGVDLLVAPPFTAIAAVAHELDGTGVFVAAQNLHQQPSGAFTGEISAPMLVESGATWVIVGHSERRQFFGETDAGVDAKVRAATAASLTPIVCVGESLAEREAGRTLEVVGAQLAAVLGAIEGADGAAVAYEPVWAIGTGKNASPGDAEAVHSAIRGWLAARSEALARRTRVLYGGSLKPDNAAALLAQSNIDGGLIGGASLDIASFGAIASAAFAHARNN